MKNIITLCLFLLFYSSNANSTSNGYWQLSSDDNGIAVYIHQHEGGLVEVKAVMNTKTSLHGFLALLQDTRNIPNWVDKVSYSRVIKQISPRENIVYTQFQAPWPAKSRDMVTYSIYTISDNVLTLQIKDAPNAIPVKNHLIRIQSVTAIWKLTTLSENSTRIEYQAYADPGGSLPNWLVNKLAKESTRNTFTKLRQQLPKYQDTEH